MARLVIVMTTAISFDFKDNDRYLDSGHAV